MLWPFSKIFNGFVSILTAIANVLDRLIDGCHLVLQAAADSLNKLTNGCHLVLESIADSLNKLTNGCLLSLAILTRRLDLSMFLLTNAVLGLTAGITLTPLLYLSQFSPVLRFIVWTMYASLCFSMVVTYIQQQHFPEGTVL